MADLIRHPLELQGDWLRRDKQVAGQDRNDGDSNGLVVYTDFVTVSFFSLLLERINSILYILTAAGEHSSPLQRICDPTRRRGDLRSPALLCNIKERLNYTPLKNSKPSFYYQFQRFYPTVAV